MHRTAVTQFAFVAKREMSSNHLLQDRDVEAAPWYFPEISDKGPQKNEFVGKYLITAVHSGDVLQKGAVMVVPAFAGSTGIMAALPVPHTLVTNGEVNAAKEGRVCDGHINVLDHAAVRAVICPSQAQASCLALFDLQKTGVKAIGAHLPPQTSLTVESASKKHPCE